MNRKSPLSFLIFDNLLPLATLYVLLNDCNFCCHFAPRFSQRSSGFIETSCSSNFSSLFNFASRLLRLKSFCSSRRSSVSFSDNCSRLAKFKNSLAAIFGFRFLSGSRQSRLTTSNRVFSAASALALRSAFLKSPISPNVLPFSKRTRSVRFPFFSRKMEIDPSRITYISSPISPSEKSSPPCFRSSG